MSNCCGCQSEISRDGSGQLSRYLKALDPSYAPVDDRSIEDLLVFAKRYANQIRFYEIPGSDMQDPGDSEKLSWREFFRRDLAVIAASIAVIDLEQFRKDYDELRIKLDTTPTYGVYRCLFDPILGMATKIDGWYSLAIPENPLYNDLQLAINSNLKEQMQKIAAYEKGFNYVDSSHPLNLDYSSMINRTVWGLDKTINPDISIYTGTEADEKMLSAALFVDDIFNSFYSFLNTLVYNAAGYMQFALEQYPAHQPHMALFVSFLKLFQLAQQQMNGITGRMLDFYYKDVLHLEAKPSIPDKVHIVFELAKDVAEYDIAEGTSLKAGKDASGKEQIYKTGTDLVVNQAKVKELKNIFIETAASSLTSKKIQAMYARPAANSIDGFGEKFTVPNSKWPTFGKRNPTAAGNKNLCSQVAAIDDVDRNDQAQIGFAIASPQLVLQGGNRLITVTLNLLKNDFAKAVTDDLFRDAKLVLSAKENWLEINSAEKVNNLEFRRFIKGVKAENNFHDEDFKSEGFTTAYLAEKTENETTIEYIIDIYMPVAEQSIIAFDQNLHLGYPYKTAYPVLQIIPGNDVQVTDYDFTSVTNIALNVQVGSINKYDAAVIDIDDIFLHARFNGDGLKVLNIENDNGLVTSGKPFDPFTEYPKPGSALYIGSDEAFNKPLDLMSVNIQFLAEMNNDASQKIFALLDRKNLEGDHAYLKASVREKKQWTVLSRKDGFDFTFNTLTQNILFRRVNTTAGEPFVSDRNPISKNEQLNNDTNKGFIKIENDLLYRREGNKGIFELMQELAQVIKIKEISVSYHANLDRLEPGIDQVFHVYPFGVVETYLNAAISRSAGIAAGSAQPKTSFADLDSKKNLLLVDAKQALLPQFKYLSPYAKYYETAAKATAIPGRIRSSINSFTNGTNSLITAARNNVAARLMLDAAHVRERSQGFSNQYTGILQEGMLFIGLENLNPLQSISMLFQFAEGSAENEDDDPPVINWSYLTYNEWRPLKAENIISDGTYNFQTTGIVKIDVPADASAHNTIITDGLIWFCASVTEHAERIPQLIDVVTQAVEAKFEDNDNDQSHFDKVLAPGSISKLEMDVAEIGKVEQPFASYDGKHKEIGKEYYTRVSERLRHKARAINAWDYEHLVLDRFPSIYKVKCITHTGPECICRDKSFTSKPKNTVLPIRIFLDRQVKDIKPVLESIGDEAKSNPSLNITLVGYGTNAALLTKSAFLALTNGLPTITIANPVSPERINSKVILTGNDNAIDIIETETCCGPQVAPGHVLIVPIASLKNRNSANPLQPKTSRRTLLAIEDYLKKRVSAFVKVHAKNPVYEQIIVSFKVKFFSGTDKGFYMKKLNDEIVHFLTPWAFDETAEVKFNQKIYASSIINFIEERKYVDFITDFIMGVCCDDCCAPVTTNAKTDIVGTIKDSAGKPLENVTVTEKERGGVVKSGADGSYEFSVTEAGPVTLNFSFSGYQPEEVLVGKNTTVDVVLYKFSEALQHICSCKNIEWLLQSDPGFEGDIVAKPCTSRSILVSVPQHIIVPYEPPTEESDCEKRINAKKLMNLTINKSPGTVTKAVPGKPKKLPAKQPNKSKKKK